jgi:hypothetical protein
MEIRRRIPGATSVVTLLKPRNFEEAGTPKPHEEA